MRYIQGTIQDKLGKHYFLTKEEAEKALEEKVRNNMAKCKNCKNLNTILDSADFQEKEYPWCFVKNDSPDIEMERDCDKYECMTNANRIRNMTDEELAKYISDLIKGTQQCCEYSEYFSD